MQQFNKFLLMNALAMPAKKDSAVVSAMKFLNDEILSKILIVALLGAGIWFSLRLGFVQVKDFKKGWRRTFGGLFGKKTDAGKDGMSSFQALATAIAAQVGTGNIAGAATAIATGGPGAIFWMWLAAFLGMATIYGEALMAQKYKKVDDDGTVTGGPVYYILAAFKYSKFGKFMAGLFAVLITFALGFMGNAVQSNSIAAACNVAFGVNMKVMGVIIAILAFLVFSGGVKRIAKFTETVVPIMAAFYIIGSLIVIIGNAGAIPGVFKSIFVGAFTPQAIFGGTFGYTVKKALQMGIARGLFSNEAGMGSTPHAHAVAKVDHPVEQGQVAMVGVFMDTFIILNLTAFVILTTGALQPDGKGGSTLTGAALTQAGFDAYYGHAGVTFIAICMFFFAFSTIIGWYFFGEANIRYLFGEKAIKPYSIIVCICVFLGTFAEVPVVWSMADLFNSMMVVPNIIGLLLLSNVIVEVHRDYKKKVAKGELKEPGGEK